MATEEVPASDALREVLVEVIVAAVRGAGLPIPEPIIRVAVRSVLAAVTDIDPETIRDILDRLGIPQLFDEVKGRVFGREDDGDDAEQDDDEEDDVGQASVECPESGDTITLDDGEGTYSCPDCSQDIVVDADGDAAHALVVECPVEDENFWVAPEDGTFECPECGMDVVVEDGKAEHDPVPSVKCPRSKSVIMLTQDEGEYRCPDCTATITVEDGEAVHERPPRRGS